MTNRNQSLVGKVLFITGATRGIGLATLHKAVEQGAKVFYVAREDEELQSIQEKMRRMGYETAYAVCDVAEKDQIERAVELCLKTFGRIDAFINNAGVTSYQTIEEISVDEAKRIFDTNFWGVVNGSRAALPALRKSKGRLINIGSVLSEVALPLQGIYSASKFAVRGFTNALRRELLGEESGVSVTLIMPSAINTPRRYEMYEKFGALPPSRFVYSADVVAKAILRSVENPIREVRIGAAAFIFPWLERFLPKLQDRILANHFMENRQRRSLLEPSKRKELFPGHVMKSSIVAELSYRKSLLASGVGAGALFWLFLRKKSPSTHLTT